MNKVLCKQGRWIRLTVFTVCTLHSCGWHCGGLYMISLSHRAVCRHTVTYRLRLTVLGQSEGLSLDWNSIAFNVTSYEISAITVIHSNNNSMLILPCFNLCTFLCYAIFSPADSRIYFMCLCKHSVIFPRLLLAVVSLYQSRDREREKRGSSWCLL